MQTRRRHPGRKRHLRHTPSHRPICRTAKDAWLLALPRKTRVKRFLHNIGHICTQFLSGHGFLGPHTISSSSSFSPAALLRCRDPKSRSSTPASDDIAGRSSTTAMSTAVVSGGMPSHLPSPSTTALQLQPVQNGNLSSDFTPSVEVYPFCRGGQIPRGNLVLEPRPAPWVGFRISTNILEPHCARRTTIHHIEKMHVGRAGWSRRVIRSWIFHVPASSA